MVYLVTHRQAGKVITPVAVFAARMPFAFTSFYGKVPRLDKKLRLPQPTAIAIREQVASISTCLFCVDVARWLALRESADSRARYEALPDYRTSPLFTEAERAALDYATELTTDKKAEPATFARLARFYSEREICDIVWLVASEHLGCMTNIALNIGSDGLCELPTTRQAGSPQRHPGRRMPTKPTPRRPLADRQWPAQPVPPHPHAPGGRPGSARPGWPDSRTMRAGRAVEPDRGRARAAALDGRRQKETGLALAKAQGGDLYHEEKGDGVPVLLIHPAGATASTWGSAADDLAHVARVIAYDRRGCGRSAGEPVRSIPRHAADATAILDTLQTPPAVVVGTSVGATIAIDLALRRPDLVRAVIAHESPWRATRHIPTTPQLAALAGMSWLALRGQYPQAAERFLRFAYTYRDGGTAWEAFPAEWRRTARDNAKAALADIRIAVGGYPSRKELAAINCPVVCTYGERSAGSMVRITRSLARAMPTATLRQIEGAGHAAAFDAPANFVQVIAEATRLS
jgi:pimeloyl-ACP methyl ester carboxylesterase/alkylhydroperoxidase family enzyme